MWLANPHPILQGGLLLSMAKAVFIPPAELVVFLRLSTQKKAPRRMSGRLLIGIRQRPTLPGRLQPSTIGAQGLNFCVRYGNRWIPFAIATGSPAGLGASRSAHPENCTPEFRTSCFSTTSWSLSRILLDQALDRLVSSSSKRYRSSTDDLSPGSLPGVLLLSNGTLLLEGGFTLRCLQRLSRPHFASLLCRWHDNSCTSGASTPVLSY